MREKKVIFLCLVALVVLLAKHFFCNNKNSKKMINYNDWKAHEDETLRTFLKLAETGGKPKLTVFRNTVDNNLEVGYGHVVKAIDNLKLGDTITKAHAELLLTNDIIKHKKIYDFVLSGTKIKLGIARLLVSHAYNTGTCSVTLSQMAKEGYINKDWHTSHYITSAGKVVQGLINRRRNELKFL